MAEIEPHLAQTRVKDAAIDPYGGIVLGTYNEQSREPVGGVYRIAPNGEVVTLFSGVAAANGLAFSPDGRIMYFTDTTEGTIRRFALAPQFGGLAELGPLAGPNIAPGSSDGATVDIEGGYWSARLRGGCVVRIDGNGHLTDRVDMPSRAPTCGTWRRRSENAVHNLSPALARRIQHLCVINAFVKCKAPARLQLNVGRQASAPRPGSTLQIEMPKLSFQLRHTPRDRRLRDSRP
ncbi:SMP-30/gluconolactonase/LRE family protein [Mesorhizobium sp.]|uniref:SMP-30/gluconolactonase/LRE family protein n=1 Tax=Mesorhizobium sp. TaxID=1871066 RepID=UPI003458D7EE